MKKVLFFTNVPVPYRMHFFRQLSNEVELTVCFQNKSSSFQYNYDYNSNGFKALFLCEHKKPSAIAKTEIKKRYDYLIFGDYSSKAERNLILFCKRKKIKYGIEIDGAICKNENILKKTIKRFLISNASFFFSSSKESDNYLIKYGAKRDNIFRYHFSSISKNVFSDAHNQALLKKRLELNPNKPLLLFVGRFVPRKGVDVLLESLFDISDLFQTVLIGGSPTEEHQTIISKHNLKNISFIDFAKSEIVNAYYDAADIFVLPTREDIWGLVINEAMAHRCAIITTTRCNAGIELIENNVNGFLVEPDDSDAINASIKKLLNDANLLETMKKNNFEKIKGYTIESMVTDHILVFNKQHE